MVYTVISDGKRSCIICKEFKELQFFAQYKYTTKQGKRKQRYSSRCKACESVRRKERTLLNSKRQAAQSKAWRESRVDYVRDKSKEYRQSIKGKAKRAECQRLRDKRIKLTSLGLTIDEQTRINEIYQEAQLLRAEGVQAEVDHIKPLSKNGAHHPDNLQILTKVKNMEKGAKYE